LYEQKFYTNEFVQFVLDSSAIEVKLLNDWYHPDGRNGIPLFCRLKFEDMEIRFLYEYEYNIIWIKYDSDKKLNESVETLKKELSRIIKQFNIDAKTIRSHPNNVFSVSSLDGYYTPAFMSIIWNSNNCIFVVQKPVARSIGLHVWGANPHVRQRHTGRVGLETLIDDEKREKKLSFIPDFISEATRKTLAPDQLNACVMPTENAGTVYKVATEKILNINGPTLDKFRKTSKTYRYWESQDRKFRTTAKFVSFDKSTNKVTLEKPNGKKTVARLHQVRYEDMKYIREQMNENSK
jgi:hypothetical protein